MGLAVDETHLTNDVPGLGQAMHQMAAISRMAARYFCLPSDQDHQIALIAMVFPRQIIARLEFAHLHQRCHMRCNVLWHALEGRSAAQQLRNQLRFRFSQHCVCLGVCQVIHYAQACRTGLIASYNTFMKSLRNLPAQAHLIPAPHMGLLALELRAFWEFGAVLPAWPALMQAPRGDGHRVIVLPGLAANDTSTVPLRKYLESLGYEVTGWQMGSNFGPRAGVLDGIKQLVQQTFEASGKKRGHRSEKVSLIGWSLGGIYAREIAKEMPECVRSVITLGTPFAGGPRSTNAWRLYEMVSNRKIDREEENFELHVAPSMPATSVYSKTDGIVAWQGSIQSQDAGIGHAQTENVQVLASHFGIGLNPSAWWVVADRLAQAQGQWKPFRKPKLLGFSSLVFPDSESA
jgi:pimeloyl-ACP methyl ester carboxylesterase